MRGCEHTLRTECITVSPTFFCDFRQHRRLMWGIVLEMVYVWRRAKGSRHTL
jgi:hypothetical protein